MISFSKSLNYLIYMYNLCETNNVSLIYKHTRSDPPIPIFTTSVIDFPVWPEKDRRYIIMMNSKKISIHRFIAIIITAPLRVKRSINLFYSSSRRYIIYIYIFFFAQNIKYLVNKKDNNN